MCFLIEDDDLLEKHNTHWDKVSADIYIKKIDSEPVYNKEFLKTKIKSCCDEDFYNKKIPKVDSNHTCLTIISLDSALKKDENYYPQLLLKDCKYIENKVISHINQHINDNLSDFLLVNLTKNNYQVNVF